MMALRQRASGGINPVPSITSSASAWPSSECRRYRPPNHLADADKQMKTFCALGDKIAHKRGFSTQIG